MYGISKEIRGNFAVLTTPSFGTIKPALLRLEKNGFIKTQKAISDGGRPSTFYSITKEGVNELKRLLLAPPLENPVQFIPNSLVKLACAEVLDKEEQLKLFSNLKTKAESLIIDTQNIMSFKDLSFFPKMVYDNILLEYKNFITLLEGFEHAGSRE